MIKIEDLFGDLKEEDYKTHLAIGDTGDIMKHLWERLYGTNLKNGRKTKASGTLKKSTYFP